MASYKTPLRYPGGKQRLWPFIDELLSANGLLGGHYVEPYAGGAGIAFELLLRGRVKRVHLNDSCIALYSLWHSIINEAERFCRRISRASLTVDEWKKQREIFKRRDCAADTFDLGFATFYLNRCNRSGILNAGVIGGLAQRGKWKIDARFPRNDLIRRVEAIAARKSDIKIRNWDAERFLTKYIPRLPKRTLVYCDPPYFLKADRLYYNHYKPADHTHLAEVIQLNIHHPWIVSYDYCEEVLRHYRSRKAFCYQSQYSAAKAYKGAEIFIVCDDLQLPTTSSISAINNGLQFFGRQGSCTSPAYRQGRDMLLTA
jgi:DNA adenine methylase